MNKLQSDDFLTVGWREWLALPELGINKIKAKVDTGARTSAIHAFRMETFKKNHKENVRFWIHPIQNDNDTELVCEAPVIDERWVTDSGGHRERRIVIESLLAIPGREWRIELTLTDRDMMRFRMLLGRTAMRNHVVVNPGKSYLLNKMKR